MVQFSPLLALAPFRDWDIDLLRKINGGRNPFWDHILLPVTLVTFYVAYGIPLLMALISIPGKKVRLRLQGLYILCALLFSGLMVNLIKPLVGRIRPWMTYPFVHKLGPAGGFSFPSGHAGDVFTLVTGLFLIIPRKGIGFLFYGWALVVIYSRMYLGAHYPTDILGGACIGILSSLLFYTLFRRWFRAFASPDSGKESTRK